MPELMITATPNPLPSTTANANALSQNDASTRTGESTKADTGNGVDSPFANVLKSRMDKKKAPANEADSSGSSAAAPQAAIGNAAAGIDFSGLLPLLGSNPATNAKATPTSIKEQTGTNPDGNVMLALQAGTELAAGQTPLALPSAPPTQQSPLASAPSTQPLAQASVPQTPSTLASSPPSQMPSTQPSTQPSEPAAIKDAVPRKQVVDAKNETFTSAGTTKADPGDPPPGKLSLDAAINADVGHRSDEAKVAELPANDFHALLERAAAMTPDAVAAARGASSSASLRIDTPLGQTGWHDEMGQKLTWMVSNNRQQADLVLNPPHLGRVEVSLTMNGDQATAIFTSSNPTVRDALEASLHRLREVLADAGVSLGQAQVGSESPQQSPRNNEADFGPSDNLRYASTIPLPATQTVTRTGAGRSMVDIFA